MDRLTRKSQSSDMVWFVDHENSNMNLEPCEMNSHHNRLAIQKLAEYEDVEEQGLLLRLPVAEGTEVFVIVEAYVWGEVVDDAESWYTILDANFDRSDIEDFGKTVFLTREEAEVALEKMKREVAKWEMR